MTMERLFKETRERMGTKKERQLAHDRRSAEFDKQCAVDFEAQKVTPELLARRCTL